LNREVNNLLTLAKSIKKHISLKEIVIVALAVIVSVSAGVGAFHLLKKDVVIDDNGSRLVVQTMKYTVGEVLEQNGITVASYDYISMPLDAKLKSTSENIINIKRAVPVNILADGKEVMIMTYHDTVREALNNSQVYLGINDRLEGAEMDDPVTSGMDIRVIRVKEEIQSENQFIPFTVEYRENRHMNKGEERIVREGKEGIRELFYRVVFEDGKEIARELISNTLLSNPVNRLVEVGTVLTHTTARGEVVRYKKVLDMKVTAYTASFKDTGKNPDHPEFGITYTGIRAKRGIIAVDPKVIPLGTKVYVEIAGNTPDYGYALAADTGGAIKGNIIDVYLDSQEEVDRWGVKRCKVYILAEQ
jgi:uncharacterized protein YabE (DUF348 family)